MYIDIGLQIDNYVFFYTYDYQKERLSVLCLTKNAGHLMNEVLSNEIKKQCFLN